MSLFLLLLYICLYIIMAIIVWFDKKDGKGRNVKLGEVPETDQMQYFADGGGGGAADLADGEVRASQSFLERLLDQIDPGWGI